LCSHCGKTPYLESLKAAGLHHRYCETCYLKNKAKNRLGSRRSWTALKERLQAQGGRCSYTGFALVLGVNDSVDHIKPLDQHPELRSDPTNIEWVCREVNEMKRNRTPEEFLSFLRTILAYRSC
jgi:5-methylcytosine-specific restriction endonuclease McrA